MSKIAEALAKAKERTGHTTAPFLLGTPAVSVDVLAKKEAALRRARRMQRFWVALSSLALALTAFIIWTRLQDMKAARMSDTATEGAEAVASEAAPVSGAPSRVELVSEAPLPVVLPTASEEAGLARGEETPAAPRLEVQAEVNALVFTAVLPGERPRLMYKGRIVGVGERVEGELIFAGVHEGRLVFNDAAGAIYLRRY